MEAERLQQFVELLFDYIQTVPAKEFSKYIEDAEDAIAETDPDDVLYVACALGCESGIWSDDSHFEEQDVVPVFTTNDVLDMFFSP